MAVVVVGRVIASGLTVRNSSGGNKCTSLYWGYYSFLYLLFYFLIISLINIKFISLINDLDVGYSPPGAVVCSKGWAVRPLKRYVSWVQNVVRQFGPYPVWALEH